MTTNKPLVGARFCELKNVAVIAFSGEDAASFLHAQLTSDVAGLSVPHTQYSGYCTPKGRLLASFLLWRREADILLMLPAALRESVQQRLCKYVLRSRVRVADMSERFHVFGIEGHDAACIVRELRADVPNATHDVVCAPGLNIARLPEHRYVVLADSAMSPREVLASKARQQDELFWTLLDIEAGIPVITPSIQEHYVPQMVNLDLVGGVSYTKGCYPGQEIVARTHYLGRLKQRMYRIRIPASDPVGPGDPLFSAEFGSGQASGSIVQAVSLGAREHQALAVAQAASVLGGKLHYGSLDGPAVDVLPLPYVVAA